MEDEENNLRCKKLINHDLIHKYFYLNIYLPAFILHRNFEAKFYFFVRGHVKSEIFDPPSPTPTENSWHEEELRMTTPQNESLKQKSQDAFIFRHNEIQNAKF